MKYMTLIFEQHGGMDGMPETEHQALITQHRELQELARERGVYVAAVQLKLPQRAQSLRVRDTQSMISDGPFAESKEYFIGYYLFDCASLADALDLARRIPTAQGGGMEIRPVDEATGCAAGAGQSGEFRATGKSMFALLNYHPQSLLEKYSDEMIQPMITSNFVMSQKAAANGDYLGGYKLMLPATATELRGENSQRQVFDGPFCEAKEVLLGLHILACKNSQAALEYASMLDDARNGVVELRPIEFLQHSDPEMLWNSTD